MFIAQCTMYITVSIPWSPNNKTNLLAKKSIKSISYQRRHCTIKRHTLNVLMATKYYSQTTFLFHNVIVQGWTKALFNDVIEQFNDNIRFKDGILLLNDELQDSTTALCIFRMTLSSSRHGITLSNDGHFTIQRSHLHKSRLVDSVYLSMRTFLLY